MKRKVISTALAAAMLLSMAAPSAYAEDIAVGATAAETNVAEQETYAATPADAVDTVVEMQPDGSYITYKDDSIQADTYAADESGIKLATPTDLQWHVAPDGSTQMGAIAFSEVPDCEGRYSIKLYWDGRETERYLAGGRYSENGSNLIYDSGLIDNINLSGTYTFSVQAWGNGGYTDSDVATSGEFVYTRPSTSVGAATNLYWDETDKSQVHFTLPENAGGYYLKVYYRAQGSETWVDKLSYRKFQNTSMKGEVTRDISSSMEAVGDYCFAVTPVSYDITKVANGMMSEKSAVLPFTETVAYINSSVDAAIAALKDGSKTADEVKADLQAQNTNTVKAAMQASTDSYDKIAELEKLYNEQKGVEVKTNINEGVELGGEATIVGAGLNATGSTVTLNIARPAEADRKIDASLRSLLEISMELDGAKTGELDVPVCITLPVPEGAREDTLRILHYHADGTCEIIRPKFVTIDGVLMARFSLTSFSDFVFADASAGSDDNTGDNDNTGNNDNNGNTGTTDTTGVEGFVDRLYSVCLGRPADAAGKADWVGQLTSYQISGTKAAYGFIFSEEFTNKNYSNADYVEHLYEAFMGRASDEGGKADWVGKLDAGTTREEVFNGFANSVEFDNICKSYGIVSKDIETFVTRLYSVCLDRQPDDAGLADWANQLRSQTISGKAAASGFVFSEEFTSKNYSNADYVEHLYAAFMGRASDEGGKADWVSKLDAGTTREEVFNGFADSEEFNNICTSYGIVRG